MNNTSVARILPSILRVLLSAFVLLSTGFLPYRIVCRTISLLIGLSHLKEKEGIAIAALIVLASFSPLQTCWPYKKIGMLAYYGLSLLALWGSRVLVQPLLSATTFRERLQSVMLYSFLDQLLCAVLFHGVAGIPLTYLVDSWWTFTVTVLVTTQIMYLYTKATSVQV